MGANSREYARLYWNKHKKHLNSLHRKYWFKHHKKNLKRAREYYYKNKKRLNKQMKKYYLQNKNKLNKAMAKYYSKHRNKIRKYNNKRNRFIHNKNLSLWEGYIPKKTKCQICNKKIYFHNKDTKTAIHFDHKDNNLLIKEAPTVWLGRHINNLKNRIIWEKCNFGMLCKKCNLMLPTNNRKEYIQKVIKYMEKDK